MSHVRAVPVITLFTKFDAMDDKAFSELLRKGVREQDARLQASGYALEMFERDIKGVIYGSTFPPKGHVLLRGELFSFLYDKRSFAADMNHPNATCQELVNCTASSIDDAALRLLFVSTQRNNLALCIESAANS